MKLYSNTMPAGFIPRIGTLRTTPQQAATLARQLGLLPRKMEVRLSGLKRHDPPRHGPQHFARLRDELACARRAEQPWGPQVPLIWAAIEADGTTHLLDGHHRATSAQAAGYEWVPALVVDADALKRLHSATGVSRVELVEQVMPLVSELAVHNRRFGVHREQAVAGPPPLVYRPTPEPTRLVLTPRRILERLCPHTPELDVPAGQEQQAIRNLIAQLNPYQSVIAVRNALLVVIDQLQVPDDFEGPESFDVLRLVMNMTALDRQPVRRAVDELNNLPRLPARVATFASTAVLLDALTHADKYGAELEPQPYQEMRYTEGTSNKFWWYEIHGRYFTRCWGRIESGPSTMSTAYSSREAAVNAALKIEHEKMRKGYRFYRQGRSVRHARDADMLVGSILNNVNVGPDGAGPRAVIERMRQWLRLTRCSLATFDATTFELSH